jgi:ATP-dependent Clp protease ATP-binding subunit ClpA
MLFFTSNIGYSDAQQRSTPIGYNDEGARRAKVDRDIRGELRRALKPEFVNRVRLIHFNRLTRSSVDRILDLEMGRIAARYREMHDLEVSLDDSARAELIRRGFSETYGARRLAATLESVCNVELARKVRRDDKAPRDEREGLVKWLREMRDGKRAFLEDEVRKQVVEHARAKLPYDTVVVGFDGERFRFHTERRG